MANDTVIESTATVGSLERGLQVLEAVRSSLTPLSLGQIAEAVGLDASTTLRCLKILRRRGYVFRLEPSKSYTVGRAVLAPAGQTEIFFDLRRDVHPHLVQMMAETQLTATLLLIFGTSRVGLEVVQGKDRLIPYNSAEIAGPLHSTVSGKLWLLAQPRAAAEAALAGKALARYTEHTCTDPEVVLAQIAAAEARGFVETRDETLRGVFGLGAPLRARNGRILAGICLYGNSHGVSPAAGETAAARLVETAAFVSETAGSLDQIARLMR